MLQADQMGVNIGNALRVQADAMRVRRRQRAEELIAKAPVKMLFPLVAFIFPSLFVVLLGPALMKIFAHVRHHGWPLAAAPGREPDGPSNRQRRCEPPQAKRWPT